MKIARLAVLGIALTAGVAAAAIMTRSKGPAPRIAAKPAVESADILVAARELDLGTLLSPGDVKWQPWPKADVAGGMIVKASEPNAVAKLKGAVIRGQFLPGDPIRRGKLVTGANSGFLSAILPSGTRAVAINIDHGGGATAGGFVLPNDRVDVIRTFRDEAASKQAGGDVYRSETILTNVRVLAIGPNIQEKKGEHVVQGSTATLEVTPQQAQQLVLAQRVGQLSLALRSLADADQAADAAPDAAPDKSLTVVRYGIASQSD